MHSKKREGAIFVPYKWVNGELYFYMQKRDKHAERAPDLFGLFGGGLEEGEDMKTALLREVQEELSYVPDNYRYFSRYEFAKAIFYVFIQEVQDDFESRVTVCEGEYGKFLNLKDIQSLSNVTGSARAVTQQVADALVGLK